MGRKAITLDEQIQLLQNRGMFIADKEKAKEVLLDVGYYRLGFYWFPFEKNYPNKQNRIHEFKNGTNFDDVVKLYYFDFKLRNLLLKYLIRIEINFRTCLTYYTSNLYKESPTWFVDPQVVSRKQIAEFDKTVYTSKFKGNSAIALHHKKYINDKYAPAWKTLEFMTLGNIIFLYQSLNNEELKHTIASHYKINRLGVFDNYLKRILDIRNACAHGNILFDLTPSGSICKGPAMTKDLAKNQNLNGVLKIVLYMIKQVSVNRHNDLVNEIQTLIAEYTQKSEVLRCIIQDISGIDKVFV